MRRVRQIREICIQHAKQRVMGKTIYKDESCATVNVEIMDENENEPNVVGAWVVRAREKRNSAHKRPQNGKWKSMSSLESELYERVIFMCEKNITIFFLHPLMDFLVPLYIISNVMVRYFGAELN